MDPNTMLLARVIHEERIQAALKRQRQGHRHINFLRRSLDIPLVLTRPVMTRLGDLLISVGTRLKPHSLEA